MRRLLFVFALFSPLTAAYSEEPSAQVQVGRILTQARDSGALERLLETQHVFFRKTFDAGAVVLFDGQLLGAPDAPSGLRVRMALFGLTGSLAGRELQTSYDLGFDGAIQRFEVMQAHARRGGMAQGTVKGGLLEVSTRVTGTGGVSVRRLGWSDEAIPFVVCLFLARLHDQGLPDELRFRMFEGEDLRLNDYESSIERRVDPEAQQVQVTCRKRLGSDVQAYELVFDPAQPQRLRQIRVGGGGTMDPISEQEFSRLLGLSKEQGETPAAPEETPEQPESGREEPTPSGTTEPEQD